MEQLLLKYCYWLVGTAVATLAWHTRLCRGGTLLLPETPFGMDVTGV